MGLTIKEIAIDNWDTYLGMCTELIDVMLDIFMDFIPHVFFEMFLETMLDLTYCLNIFGKICIWCTLGVIIFIISMILILALLCIVVSGIVMLILCITLYLPGILIRWIHQRTTKPFFMMVFIKKECKNNH